MDTYNVVVVVALHTIEELTIVLDEGLHFPTALLFLLVSWPWRFGGNRRTQEKLMQT